MALKPSITIVGTGSLALALAPALYQAGYPIKEIVFRERRGETRDKNDSRRRATSLARKVGARAVTFENARSDADLVWLCVSDSAIRECAGRLASTRFLSMTRDAVRHVSRKHRNAMHVGTTWKGKYVFHSSGALTSDELAPLRLLGARTASLHPMMTFVRRSAPSLAGVGFALEGDAAAMRIARDIVGNLGGHAFGIRKQAKALYHAWGAFASPLLIMELALAERVARAAGVTADEARKTFEPIVRRTIDNYFAHGAAAAFSGPLVRGDVATVKRHLQRLGKVSSARDVYLALARSALKTLPVGRRKEIAGILK